jgi:hypothetical protein
MIVGAFYNDKTTTYVDITGLSPNVGYYVTGYPVDNQYNYFVQGVHAYSVAPLLNATADTNGSQTVVFNPYSTPFGVKTTDSTGLLTNQSYAFNVQVGLIPKPRTPVSDIACVPQAPVYNLTVPGAQALTFGQLVQQINEQIALLSTSTQGPNPPNTNGIFVNVASSTAATWTGYGYQQISNAVFQADQPNQLMVGSSYWYNPSSHLLQVWNGASWQNVQYVVAPNDPTAPVTNETFWVQGNTVWQWNGTVWCAVTAYVQPTDPSVATAPIAGTYWRNPTTGVINAWNSTTSTWNVTTAITWNSNPTNLLAGSYWYDTATQSLYVRQQVLQPSLSLVWAQLPNLTISATAPTLPGPDKYWYNTANNTFQAWNTQTSAWVQINVLSYPTDPTVRADCDVWMNPSTSQLFIWDMPSAMWNQCKTFVSQTTDPTIANTMNVGDAWYNSTTGQLMLWSGVCFTPASLAPIVWPSDPVTFTYPGYGWFNPTTNEWYYRTATDVWELIAPTQVTEDPSALQPGLYWYNTTNNTLQLWNGTGWVPMSFSATTLMPPQGTLWFNTSVNALQSWNGTSWVSATPKIICAFDCNGNLQFTDPTPGSLSWISITDVSLFKSLTVPNTLYDPVPGTDGVSGQPSYTEIGVGSNGDDSQRKQLQNEIRYELGYPTVDVELTEEQLDYAVTRALEELRSKSSVGYKRGFFFMHIPPETQRFYLTNKVQGMNKIVEVMGVYRLTSAFLSSAHGAGVYGQIILQHLYNMGTFDLLSYHIISEYVSLMERLFAARITFTWNEQTRELFIMHRFPFAETMVAIEAAVERSEQEMISDRYIRPWIRRYAAAVARIMLAETRGKYSSLPGANGSLQLNATDLRQAAQAEMQACILEIEQYVADRIDEYGSGAQVVYG